MGDSVDFVVDDDGGDVLVVCCVGLKCVEFGDCDVVGVGLTHCDVPDQASVKCCVVDGGAVVPGLRCMMGVGV